MQFRAEEAPLNRDTKQGAKGRVADYKQQAKVRMVPLSHRVRALWEHHFAPEKAFPIKAWRDTLGMSFK